MTIRHVYMPIDAAEKSTDSQLEGMFSGTAANIRANLAAMKSRGMEVIPSAGCDRQDEKGYCLGHESEDPKTMAATYAAWLNGTREQSEFIRFLRMARGEATAERYLTPSHIARNVKMLDELTFPDGSVLEIKYNNWGIMSEFNEKVTP